MRLLYLVLVIVISQFPDKPLPYFLGDITYSISERMIFLNENTAFPFLGDGNSLVGTRGTCMVEFLSLVIASPQKMPMQGSILIQGTSFPREVLPRVICLFQMPELVTLFKYKRRGILSSCITLKPFVGTDDEFQPSPSLSKSANTIASSSTLLRAHHCTAAVVPVIETQRASTSGQTSCLTGPGQSGLLSSTLPAACGGARGAAGPSRGSSSATPVTKPPSSLHQIIKNSKIVSLPLTEDTWLVLFWFLQTVFLQGIFACAEHQSKREELEISVADWVAFFNKHSLRMVAYKAKYGKYMATTWSAAFLLGIQRLCMQMLVQYARKDLQRYKMEWFIEEPILTYTFIGGDEVCSKPLHRQSCGLDT
ncbi:hypothetical protein BT96DRAFT_945822 [Gymnopus androsaceus JB14]|uniref:Uncharacterized protein n=1 Tax=Gymnopus androsaceus JB14 TaxID=1447944 RepID=A0A6A4GZQ7_9AGAR|nr:hypothetical protein BT96DRAFT_945822 [Gymnopus androsaceus JB14]